MKFQLISKYSPRGDQPKAIKKLVKNLNSGIKSQVLLGVTGSGKSVTGETPVLIKIHGEATCVPIGDFINNFFEKHSLGVTKTGENELLFMDKKHRIEALTINPVNKKSEWRPISQLSRHSAPKKLYHVKTACGREITTTGDHNFWVFRGGEFILLKTNQIKNTDYIPLPEEIIIPEKDLSHINILKILDEKVLFADARPFISKVLLTKTLLQTIGVLDKHYAFPREKLYQIRAGDYRGMPVSTIAQVTNTLKLDFNIEHLDKIVIGSQIHRYALPAQIPLTDNWLKLLGYYIAEGHGEPNSRFFTITAADPFIVKELKSVFQELELKYRCSNTIDFSIASKIHTELLSALMGNNSRSKKLPAFWPNLSKNQLSILLSAYFNGDGGAFPSCGEVMATTASKHLASELCYALLRFGIWARIRKRWSRALNSPRHKGDYYYYIVISGKENLHRFKKYIGFSLPQKQKRLEQLVKSSRKTNVDVIPNIGKKIHNIRKELAVSQRVFANLIQMTQGTLNAIELGINSPRRETFKKIINGLLFIDGKNKEVNKLHNLLNCRWSKVAEINEINSKHQHVYDFGIKGNETFLAGFGGLFVHNTFTMANVINEIKKPTLIVACNKTLAAQLYQEFKEFFPNNGVHYFVSYYDYYQPEAYIPQTDTYIEKDSKVNEAIDRLRHAAAQDVLSRSDVIVVASVSCIYNIGSPENYQNVAFQIKSGQKISRKDFISHLITMQYKRNDIDFKPATFRVRGEVIEIYLVTGEKIIKIEFDGDKIEKVSIAPTGAHSDYQILNSKFTLFPATFWVAPQSKLNIAIANIRLELEERLKFLKKQKKLVEAQRLEQKTNYDLEMIQETGFCHGIENYSRQLEFREAGSPPFSLVDYFKHQAKDGFLMFIDESHIATPQIRAMSVQDRIRKETLIDFGFRLPSAVDNRPLRFEEFKERQPETVYVSATPANYELNLAGSKYVVEQLIRPTGLLEPKIEIKKTENQIKDLIEEAKKEIAKKQRVLVVTLTKRLAEEISDYFIEKGIKTQYLHSEVKTMERPEILKKFRQGKFDVLVGINLLREGLDLPEVSLIAILDADKEGFLRNKTTLIQTMGRAARHKEGRVILYADKMTGSMKSAIDEINRRRKIQEDYNKKNNIEPSAIIKDIRDWGFSKNEDIEEEFNVVHDKKILEKEMKEAAKNLNFERAAKLRDLIDKLKE